MFFMPNARMPQKTHLPCNSFNSMGIALVLDQQVLPEQARSHPELR
jgi:hypothetical protein